MIGYIYRIEDILNLNIYYIGSTFNSIEERFISHKFNYYNWLKNKDKYKISIYTYFEDYGIENFKIELLGEYEVDNKIELLKIEQDKIDDNGNCVNINNAYINIENKKIQDQNYREENKDKIKEYKKKYSENNKDKIKEYGKNYREENNENISKYQKEYREENKNELNDKKKEYYEKNKDEINKKKKEYRENNKIKINCGCGSSIYKYKMNEHIKSKKHLNFIAN